MDVDALLDEHEKKVHARCFTCREPHISLLNQLLDHAISTGRRVTVSQLHSVLVAETNYTGAYNTLVNHLSEHQRGKYNKLPLEGRGVIDE